MKTARMTLCLAGAAMLCGGDRLQGQVTTDRLLRVTVGVVLPNNTVATIPKHKLELLFDADTTQRIVFQTGLMGSTSETIPPGQYHLRSMQSVTVPGVDSTYRWNVPITIAQGNDSLELSNNNAIVAFFKRPKAIAPERLVFEKVRRGVFGVESGLSHGTGFLAQMPGKIGALVVTNDHLITNDSSVSVYLDSATRVPAVVVARDGDADIALLRLPTGRCADCPRLLLASPAAGEQLVSAGDPVIALGVPLAQSVTISTGLVDGLREGIISSGVNITADNSGGPMLNLDSTVVGINVFGGSQALGAPGISGAIAISRMARLLGGLATTFAAARAPSDRAMPTVPFKSFANVPSKTMIDGIDVERYRKLLAIDADHFLMNVVTPVMYRVAQKLAEGDANAKDRDGDFSWGKQVRDWDQYVGDLNTPAVAIMIAPKQGDGDLRSAHFFRNGLEIEPIRGAPASKAKDAPHFGYYVLPPGAFAPDTNGAPARVRVVIQDMAHVDDLSERDIEGDVSGNIWNDFKAFYVATPGRPWIAAIPGLPSPEVKLKCNSDAVCQVEP